MTTELISRLLVYASTYKIISDVDVQKLWVRSSGTHRDQEELLSCLYH